MDFNFFKKDLKTKTSQDRNQTFRYEFYASSLKGWSLDQVNRGEKTVEKEQYGVLRTLWVNSCNAIPAQRLIRYWHIKCASPCGRITRNEYLMAANKYVIEFRTRIEDGA